MHDPNWTAPREGRDWRDSEILRFTAWLRGLSPKNNLDERLDALRARFLAAQALSHTERSGSLDLYDPSDKIAWYIFQAETYADGREFWIPEESARISPVMHRLGHDLANLQSIGGVEDRVRRLLWGERAQPDAVLFELLVALAYRKRGWNVAFTSERPDKRTHDFNAARPRSKWAVECKRLTPSGYAEAEKKLGVALAAPVHAFLRDRNLSLVVELVFSVELRHVDPDYILSYVKRGLSGGQADRWEDEIGLGRLRPVNWPLVNAVLARDYVYFGSSRMIELLSGEYNHGADHSMAARWRAAPGRPLFADALEQASVVSWWSQAPEAVDMKSRHFKSVIADGERQLPSDRPGIIHVGVEARRGADVLSSRHTKNALEALMYRPAERSRLRWIHCSYLEPELTTAPGESFAVSETPISYKIGSHRTRLPFVGPVLIPSDAPRT